MKQVTFFLPNIRQLKVKIWIWSALIRHSRSNVTFVFFDVTLNSNSSNISLLMLFFRINFNGIQIVNNNVPSKILCSASICQYVIPEVDGDSERGLCWSITRIRKWTKKEIKWKQSSNKIFLYHKVSNSRPCIQCTYRLLWHNPQTSLPPQDRPRVLYERGVWLTHPVEDH